MPGKRPRLGCLHLHHSNIPYIAGIVPAEQAEVIHFVDPGLMRRMTSDPGFSAAEAGEQVRRQLAWMAASGLDAILITCTNYIAMLPDEPLNLDLPVVKIDEPFFAYLCRQPSPHLLLFTNPGTVEGTMRRFTEYAMRTGCSQNVEVEVIADTFDLVMAGKTAEYAAAVADRLREAVQSGSWKSISVGQLSMADAAKQVSAETGVVIGNPLLPLREHLKELLRSVD